MEDQNTIVNIQTLAVCATGWGWRAKPSTPGQNNVVQSCQTELGVQLTSKGRGTKIQCLHPFWHPHINTVKLSVCGWQGQMAMCTTARTLPTEAHM